MMSPKRLEEMKKLAEPNPKPPTPTHGCMLRVALRDAIAEIEELQARIEEIQADATE
jgi:tRNA U34 5-methylaminomethyl-2-thiouridine-forming methyltransferase MnmC